MTSQRMLEVLKFAVSDKYHVGYCTIIIFSCSASLQFVPTMGVDLHQKVGGLVPLSTL